MRRYFLTVVAVVALLVGGGNVYGQTLPQPVADQPRFTCQADAASPFKSTPLIGTRLESGSVMEWCIHAGAVLDPQTYLSRMMVDGVDTGVFQWICEVAGVDFLYYCHGVIPGDVLKQIWVTGRHVVTFAQGQAAPMLVVTGCFMMNTSTSPWTADPMNVAPVGYSYGQRNQMSSASVAQTLAMLHQSGYATPVAQRTQPQLDAGDGKGGYWQIAAECKGSPQ